MGTPYFMLIVETVAKFHHYCDHGLRGVRMEEVLGVNRAHMRNDDGVPERGSTGL